MEPQQVSLYYSEGASDKVYHAQLAASGDGFVVNFQYGRRGAALATGSKTTFPLPYEAAKKTFDKLVKEKTGKGYSPDVSGAAYQGTENAGNKTDFVPQLLNAITEDEAMRLIEDDDWVAQEKMDGERRGVHAVDGVATGMNRKGLVVPLPQSIADEILSLTHNGAIRMDSEIIGDVLHVFDLHVVMGKSIRQSKGWVDRMLQAECALNNFNHLRSVPYAETTEEKRALWSKVKAARGEGVVFKRRDSLVKEGRPNSGGDWLKFKFIERASCIVSGINTGKRSISIKLFSVALDFAGSKDPYEEVGNVTIPPNYGMPDVGDVIDVDYLYAFLLGSLYQPVYRGKRTDIDVDACTLLQLKFKPEGRGDDESSNPPL